ncbi:MAG: glycerol-3-phosphate acyltransferase [bacterium]|nr:MAG: glycerol-3-phosphate acyltransferase [bacterium]
MRVNIMGYEFILLLVMSYALGSFPSAYLAGKLIKNIDIREHGSGNVGATNVFRVLGKTWGIVTLAVDILKGSLAIILAKSILSTDQEYGSWILLAFGLMAFLGHLFPVWLKFKGGKGVAVGAGVFLALIPVEMGFILTFFVLVVALTRYVSLGSVLSALFLPLSVYLNPLREQDNDLYPYLIATSVIALAVLVMHWGNIKRLLRGEEHKISFRSKSKQHTASE